MSAAATRMTLGQSVAQELVRAIRAGELVPGDRLPTEAGLMARFGVGRNTAREAVRSLVALGLIDVRPGRGAVVISMPSGSPLDPATAAALLADEAVDDVYDLRALLEVEIAGRAAERVDDSGAEAIATALERCRFVAEHGLSMHQADMDFHRALAATARSSLYGKVLDACKELLVPALRSTERLPRQAASVLAEHEAIVDAVLAHDASAASAAMETHMRSARRAIDIVRGRGAV